MLHEVQACLMKGMIYLLMSIKLQKVGSIILEDGSNIKVRGDEDVQLVKLLRGNFGVCIS